jgi:tRNA dimethylallyltransferase
MSFDFAGDAWFLTGPTAAGKSAVGVQLARQIGAEIVSMDSMALYRGMDIGTAKPTSAERREAPHHLIDVLDPHQEFSLAQYIAAARHAADEIAGRGRRVLFVGGTPLYLKGLLRGIFEGPPADWPLRRQLADEAASRGDKWLHERLAAIDPAAAARLHPNDARRLIRAIEVFEKTGRPISLWQQQFEVGRPAADCRVFVLDWPRAELHARIADRVRQMFAAGLDDEVRRLCSPGPLSLRERTNSLGPLSLRERARVRAADEQGSDSPHPLPLSQRERGDRLLASQREKGDLSDHPLSRTARQAVGYREVIDHLAGRRSLAETIELVERHTRQLAKRQMTWFRALTECRFVAVSGQLDAAAMAVQIATAAALL